MFFSFFQDSFPARFGGIHFVNQPWYIHALYTVIRPFLKEKTRKRVTIISSREVNICCNKDKLQGKILLTLEVELP